MTSAPAAQDVPQVIEALLLQRGLVGPHDQERTLLTADQLPGAALFLPENRNLEVIQQAPIFPLLTNLTYLSKEALNKSILVIPAKAGIQYSQDPGPRLAPG